MDLLTAPIYVLLVFAILYFFERKNLVVFDWFMVAVVVIVPGIASFLVRIGGYAVGLGTWTELLVLVIFLVASTFALTKVLGVSRKRSIGYSFSFLGLQFAIVIILGLLFGGT
jgi:hypothetical protein